MKCFECLEAPKDSKRQETHKKFIKRGIKNPMPCFKNDDYREMRILDKERVKEGCTVCKLHSLDNGTSMQISFVFAMYIFQMYFQ